jgi:hypothetical protein
MTLTVTAARLRKVAADMELLVAKGADLDLPDELVPQLVANAFVDDGTLESLARTGKKGRAAAKDGTKFMFSNLFDNLHLARL